MTEMTLTADAQDKDDDSKQQQEQQEQHQPNIRTATTTTVSKSWSISSAHVPTYSGGRIAHCRTKRGLAVVDTATSAAVVKATATTAAVDLATPSLPSPSSIPFLILPINGDLALVDANKGTKIRTVRQDALVDDDDDDGLDADAITAYALSYNDEILITCSRNHLIRQYSLNSSNNNDNDTKLWGKSGHTLPVTLMEFHPNNNVFVATASVDGSVRIWDVRGSYVTHVFRPPSSNHEESSGGANRRSSVTSIRWKANRTDQQEQQLVIAIGRDDGSIVIHNLRDDEQCVVLRDHVSAVTCMDWSPDNHAMFVSSGRDAVINLWKATTIADVDQNNTTKSKKEKKKKGNQSNINRSTEKRVTYQRIHTKPVYEQVEGMVILKQTAEQQQKGLLVATAGTMGNVRLWNYSNSKQAFQCVAEQAPNQRFGKEKGGYTDLRIRNTFADNGDDDDDVLEQQLVVADAENNLLFLSLSKEQKNLTTARTIVGNNDEILDLKILPNGTNGESTHAVVATNSAQVRLFQLGTFSCEILDGHSATVLCVDVSPCGRYIATCGKDKTMRVWQSGTCQSVAMATGHTEAVGATALSRKPGRYDVSGKAAVNGGGAFVLTASKDRTLKRWNLPGSSVLDNDNVEALFELKTFCSARAHEKDINIVSVAPNDSLVATGSQDKTIKLWKATDLSLQATLKGHKRGVWDCQFSPFDRVLASCSGDRTVKLWSLSDYSCVRTFQGHVAGALRVRFLSGGLQLVSAGADGLMKLWTIRTNECEATIDGHSDKVWALDLSPDGKQLVSGGADSQIIVWRDTTKQDEASKRAEEGKNILLEQRLANHLLYKEYEKALDIALDLEKPRQVLKVLTLIVENDIQKGHSAGLRTLRHLCKKSWSVEKVTQILQYCRDWNTRARNSHMAMLVVQAVATSIPTHTLAATDGLAQVFAGITPYAERHFDRLDRMHANAYMLDYTLFSMGSLDDDGTAQKEYADWEAKSRLVLPPKQFDGSMQTSGDTVVGLTGNSVADNNEEDEIMSIGDSSSCSSEEEASSDNDDAKR